MAKNKVAPVNVRAAGPAVNSRPAIIGICLVLTVSVAVAYYRILGHEFINFDDPDYVIENEWVKQGLTWAGFKWAFNAGHASNWHPLTWLSHMLDCQLFGLNAGLHHLTSGLFHLANTLLLFALLRSLTGSLWRSAGVAALFALHPLHVESVAWLSERKDVLSTFFGLLCLLAYGSYAHCKMRYAELEVRSTPHPTRPPLSQEHLIRLAATLIRSRPLTQPCGPPLARIPSDASQATDVSPSAAEKGIAAERMGRIWYVFALVFYALGLMSKPMLVTWPLLMLLLDLWPLDRISLESRGLSLESWKGLVMEKLPFFALAAGSGILTFIAQKEGGAVAGFSSLAFLPRIQNAIIAYAGYLQKMLWPADLAAYYPFPESIAPATVALAGFVLAAISVLTFHWRRQRPYLLVGWLWYVIILLPVIGLVQVGFQAMADRYTYLSLTGPFLMQVWGVAEATRGWRNRKPVFFVIAGILLIVGVVLTSAQAGYWRNSETLHRHTLAVTTRNPTTHLNLGSALLVQGNAAEAAEQFTAALNIRPDYAEARSNLGFALVALGRYEEAISEFRKALQTKPQGKTYFLLGNALNLRGKTAEAIVEYRHALAVDPDQAGALNDLAWVLATDADAGVRNGTEAVQLAERANKVLGRPEPMFLGTLAAAYAEAGRFADAIRTGEQARQLAGQNGLKQLAARNAQLVEEYRAGRAHREAPTRRVK
jgi:protein O-mannosyl-transferase